MSIKVHEVVRDEVIKSAFALARTNYQYGVDSLFPLIGRFDDQRKKQSQRFYERLKSDIVKGCVMPPLTLAFVSKRLARVDSLIDLESYINNNIDSGYILDGMQRLNTLKAASSLPGFDRARPLFLNVIIAEKYDMLLYRMITLNNGQKPMTPRHQIEILTKNLLTFTNLQNIVIQTEKETESEIVHGAFRLFDVAAAYTAFLTDAVNNQNNKIIDEKMNEIIVGRVMNSDLSDIKVEFSDIVSLVDKFCNNKDAKKWLRLQNNLIGFSVGAKRGYEVITAMNSEEFVEQTEKFEDAFHSINPSKVNVGRYRRELSANFFSNMGKFSKISSYELSEHFVEFTTSE